MTTLLSEWFKQWSEAKLLQNIKDSQKLISLLKGKMEPDFEDRSDLEDFFEEEGEEE